MYNKKKLAQSVAGPGVAPIAISPIEIAEGQRFKSFPRNFILKLKDHISDPEVKSTLAANYRNGESWIIHIYLNKIHKLTGYKKIAQKINNLYLLELICSIMRKNTGGELPPCETGEFSRLYNCHCVFPMEKGMRLKIK